MDFNIVKHKNFLVLEVFGDISSMGDAAEFKSEVTTLLKDSNCKKLAIDLGSVQFLNSSSLGVLVYAYNYLEKKKGRFYILSPSFQLKSIFSVSGLDAIIKFANSKANLL